MNERERRRESQNRDNQDEGDIARYERYRYGGGNSSDYEDNDSSYGWSIEELANRPDDIDGTLHIEPAEELVEIPSPKMAWEHDDYIKSLNVCYT